MNPQYGRILRWFCIFIIQTILVFGGAKEEGFEWVHFNVIYEHDTPSLNFTVCIESCNIQTYTYTLYNSK